MSDANQSNIPAYANALDRSHQFHAAFSLTRRFRAGSLCTAPTFCEGSAQHLETFTIRPNLVMAGSVSTKKSSSKRKFQDALASRKRTKIQHRNADDLPWKSVSRPSQTGLAGDDGVLELEEVEGVEVVYEETDGGKVVKFNVSELLYD